MGDQRKITGGHFMTYSSTKAGLVMKHSWAVIIVVSVALLFFCPAAHGGFQASHGPTSTLKESVLGVLVQFILLVYARMIFLLAGAFPATGWSAPDRRGGKKLFRYDICAGLLRC